VKVHEQVSATKQVFGPEDALALAATVDRIVASKGRRVIEVDLRRDRPSRDELLKLLLGPTGKLRAPSLLQGRILVVGFDEASYSKLLL